MRRLLIVLVALGLLAGPLLLFAEADDRSPADFWVGPSFEGLAVKDEGSFFYGDCEPPPGEGGCAPPLEIQNSTTCERNPVALDVSPRRLFRERGGAIVGDYGDSFDVGVGGHTVTVFADTRRRARAAVGQLRRRSQAAPPARLAPPAYPYRVRQELKRVLVARKRSPTARGIARRTGVPVRAVRTRLALGRLVGARALRGIPVPRRSWRAVEHDRQVSFTAGEESVGAAARQFRLTHAQVRRAVRRVRGLTGSC